MPTDAVVVEQGERQHTHCIAFAMHCHHEKLPTFPSLRVEAELREAAESVLREGETLTSLIEAAMRETIHRRRVQAEFLARGLKSSEDAKRTGVYHPATAVHGELQRRLDARRKQVLG